MPGTPSSLSVVVVMATTVLLGLAGAVLVVEVEEHTTG